MTETVADAAPRPRLPQAPRRPARSGPVRSPGIDAARAAGRPPELSTGHDGRIVAEWARRRHEPFALQLTGPAGGSHARDPGQPGVRQLSLDAVGFCRTLARRAPAPGLLTTIVPC